VGYEIDRASGGAGYIPLPVEVAVSGGTLVVPEATQAFVESLDLRIVEVERR
jgi:hypothetical protein